MPVYRARLHVEEIYVVYIQANDSGDAYIAADMLTFEDLEAAHIESSGEREIVDYDNPTNVAIGAPAHFDAADLLKRD